MKIESEKIFKDIEDLLLCRYSEASHENNLMRIDIFDASVFAVVRMLEDLDGKNKLKNWF